VGKDKTMLLGVTGAKRSIERRKRCELAYSQWWMHSSKQLVPTTKRYPTSHLLHFRARLIDQPSSLETHDKANSALLQFVTASKVAFEINNSIVLRRFQDGGHSTSPLPSCLL
jgi:hypothetical protein